MTLPTFYPLVEEIAPALGEALATLPPSQCRFKTGLIKARARIRMRQGTSPIPKLKFRERPMEAATHDDSPSRGYDKEIVDRVWRFAQTIRGNDPELWRKDEFGAWLHKLDFGNRHSQFGWEIADFGAGESGAGIATLRPFQWQNYLEQATARTRSRITADGLRNVRVLL